MVLSAELNHYMNVDGTMSCKQFVTGVVAKQKSRKLQTATEDFLMRHDDGKSPKDTALRARRAFHVALRYG